MSSQALLCIPDARLRSLFSLLLTDSDAQVTACNDTEEFQRVLVTRFYDLCAITLDATADMAAFIKTARYLSPDSRLLLIANKDDVERIIPLFPLGISEVLLQPINPKKAIAAIHKLLEAREGGNSPEMVEEGGAEHAGGQQTSAHRTHHIVARSPAMRAIVSQLWQARQEPLGVILKGEPGSEFELIAREYQSMCGDPNGYLYVLGHLGNDLIHARTRIENHPDHLVVYRDANHRERFALNLRLMKVLEPERLPDEHCNLLKVDDDVRENINFVAFLLDDVPGL